MKYYTASIACEIVAFIAGFVCVITGAVVISLFEKLFRDGVEKGVSLVAGSQAFESFLNPQYTVILDVWFFNLTNADRYFNGVDKKPLLKQSGPYKYSETVHKTAQILSNGSIEYTTRTLYTYMPRLGVSEGDLITTSNVPLLTLYHTFRVSESDSDVVQSVISQIADLTANRKAFVTKSVRELMFEGYDDPLLQMAALVGKGPKKMGFFYGKNDTESPKFLIDKHGKLLRFQGNDKLANWDSPEANMLNGSDGTIFPPFLDRSTGQYVFSTDICRSITMKCRGNSFVSGIPTYTYEFDPKNYDATLPGNSGFCLPSDPYYSQMGSNTVGGKVRSCLPAGMFNISNCNNGAPLVISQPHFNGTSVEAQTSVLGLNPNQPFDTIIQVEPSTGLSLHIEKRSQLNVAVYPFVGFNLFGFPLPSLTANAKPAIIPVLWLNETVSADANTLEMIRSQVVTLKGSVQGGMIALMVIGGILMFGSVAAHVYFKIKRSKSQPPKKTKADGTDANGNPPAYDNVAFKMEPIGHQITPVLS